MKAILMAAGYGGRISNFTNQPKSLLKINGKPIIRHTVEMLEKNNIEVVVITGYKHELIEEELKGLKVKYYYNPFFRVTNSIASLWIARKELDDGNDYLLCNADVYYKEDILNILLSTKKDIFMLGDVSRALTGDYFFKVENGKIVKYGKELLENDRTCEYVGLARINNSNIKVIKNQIEYLVEDGKYDLWWENALYSLSDNLDVNVIDVEEKFWAEVDYLEDYERIKKHEEKNKVVC